MVKKQKAVLKGIIMERTKGKIEIHIGKCTQNPGRTDIVSGNTTIACCEFLDHKSVKEANAKHLRDCWNAFEKGGLVGELKAKIKKLERAYHILLEETQGNADIYLPAYGNADTMKLIKDSAIGTVKQAEAVLEKADAK